MSEAEVEDGEETVDVEEQIKPFLFETEKELMSYSMVEARVRDRFMVFVRKSKTQRQRRKPEYFEKSRFIIKASNAASDLCDGSVYG